MMKTEYEYWAMKDTEQNKLVSNKFGRTLWIKKPNPKQINFIGYRSWERGSSMLKPVRVTVTEVGDGTKKCVSCGGPAQSDFCEFCLKEE